MQAPIEIAFQHLRTPLTEIRSGSRQPGQAPGEVQRSDHRAVMWRSPGRRRDTGKATLQGRHRRDAAGASRRQGEHASISWRSAPFKRANHGCLRSRRRRDARDAKFVGSRQCVAAAVRFPPDVNAGRSTCSWHVEKSRIGLRAYAALLSTERKSRRGLDCGRRKMRDILEDTKRRRADRLCDLERGRSAARRS